jgi:hypothetical protein
VAAFASRDWPRRSAPAAGAGWARGGLAHGEMVDRPRVGLFRHRLFVTKAYAKDCSKKSCRTAVLRNRHPAPKMFQVATMSHLIRRSGNQPLGASPDSVQVTPAGARLVRRYRRLFQDAELVGRG